jgi:hypothetical protein
MIILKNNNELNDLGTNIVSSYALTLGELGEI